MPIKDLKAAIEQLEKTEKEKQLMRQLVKPDGFFDYYFKQLKHYTTNIDCFNAVNDMYFDFFGEYRYSSYKSFQNQQYKKHQK